MARRHAQARDAADKGQRTVAYSEGFNGAEDHSTESGLLS